MKKFLAAFAIAALALAFAPHAANAQNYEDIIANHTYDPSAKNQRQSPDAAAAAMYGDPVTDDSGEAATGDGDNADTSEQSYDQSAAGSDAPQDIYNYVAGQTKLSASDRRAANAKEADTAARKTRAAALRKMQDNSTALLKKQKERAWKLAHPGQEYHGDDNADDNGNGDPAYSEGDGDNGGGDEANDNGDGGDGNEDADNDGGADGGGDSGGDGSGY